MGNAVFCSFEMENYDHLKEKYIFIAFSQGLTNLVGVSIKNTMFFDTIFDLVGMTSTIHAIVRERETNGVEMGNGSRPRFLE